MLIDEPALSDRGGAPASAFEPRILELFRQAFGRDTIEADDDFFEIGGDSLLAGQILARVRELGGAPLPPNAIFSYPTARSLAYALEATDDEWEVDAEPSSSSSASSASFAASEPSESSESPESPDASPQPWNGRRATVTVPIAGHNSSLVQLNRGGRGRPIYLIHGASGNPWVFRALVEEAQFTRPVCGLRTPDLDWERDVLSIGETAQHYITEIRRRQRHGPYTLAGYSFGGQLAIEIANRMVDDGQEIEHLVMLDTDAPVPRWRRLLSKDGLTWAISRYLCLRGRRGLRLLDAVGITASRRQAFLALDTGPLSEEELRRLLDVSFAGYSRRDDLRDASFEDLCALIVRLFDPEPSEEEWMYLNWRDPGEEAVVLVKALKVWAKNYWHGMYYRPRAVFPGSIVIYACVGRVAVQGWQQYARRPIDVRWVPISQVDHTSFLDQSQVTLFARDMQQLLEPDRV